MTLRVGVGYDIHRTTPGTFAVIGGVEIPSQVGLEGHSDADVALHALMDALLGAAGLGDIGEHFPPSDDRFRGVSSVVLLERVMEILRERSYRVVNVDVAVVAERPKLAPHRAAMVERLAQVLQVERDCVSVKATTNEGVGPEGRGEAISAHAVALLERSG